MNSKASMYSGELSKEEIERLKKFQYPDQESLKLLPKNLSGQLILDVGAGPRTKLGDEIKKRKGKYISLDRLWPMTKAQKENDTKRAVVQADILHLPFKDKEINIIHTRFVIMNLPQNQRGLAIKELARTGKINYVLDWDWSTFKQTNDLLRSFVKNVYQLARLVGTDLEQGGKLKQLIIQTLDEQFIIEEQILNRGLGDYYLELVSLAESGAERWQSLKKEEKAKQLISLAEEFEKNKNLEPFILPDIVVVKFSKN